MLRVNVGLSRKLSHDYNSTGFSVNLEGEIPVSLDDPEGMLERIKEFYDLAEESLAQQIDRYEGESAIASRDEPVRNRTENRAANGGFDTRSNGSRPTERQSNRQNGSGDRATNKQVQFLLNIGKREGLSKPQLENRVAEILGQNVGIYDLTKRDAGVVLDALTASAAR